MKRSGSLEVLLFVTIVLGGLFYVFRPVPVTRENSLTFYAAVYQVAEGPEKNVILKLEDGRGVYYINHGLEKGLNLQTLREKLTNRQVTVRYLRPSFLAGFSPVASTKYITELKLGDSVIYSELD